ncbi:hypothetical protein ABZ456_25100 [Streptomyces sp. NPDC005776]|uniref:hypothetical protein n=1 Tax=Streptomyces sp. NPDC005776 TaxID=3154676 RepID=UPI0033D67B39
MGDALPERRSRGGDGSGLPTPSRAGASRDHACMVSAIALGWYEHDEEKMRAKPVARLIDHAAVRLTSRAHR